MDISISKRNVNHIRRLQNITKLKLEYLKELNEELNSVYTSICSVMGNLDEHIFANKLIKKERYNIYVEKIERVFEKYKTVPNPANINTINKLGKKNLRLIVNDMFEQLYMICEDIGAFCCSDVISILKMERNGWYKSVSSQYTKLINFYDRFFIPTTSKIIKNKDDINKIYSITKIEHNDLPFAKKMDKTGLSLLEKVDGAVVYFPLNSQLIMISGYFKQDPINITRHNGTFGHKLELLNADTDYLDIPDQFKQRYIEQLSLRDFIILTNREIILQIKRSYDELKKYKNKTLSSLVNEFVKGTVEKQRKIITLFLMSTDEDQFKAQIIFDLISDNSLVFQAKPHAEQIYNSLHWSIKKNFKVVLKNIQDKKRRLESISYSDIPYESRIVSMKVPNHIIKKAMDKLKEFKISKENGGKARQYLDGLLDIPFGYYHKEDIFTFFKEYFDRLEKFITITNCRIDDIDNDELNVLLQDIVNNYYTIIENYNEGTVSNYIKYLEKDVVRFRKFVSIKEDIAHIDDKIVEKIDSIINVEEDIEEEVEVKSDDVEMYKKSLKELEFYNNIKDTLIGNGLLTDNHATLISEKLETVENRIGLGNDKEDDSNDVDKFVNYTFLEIIKLINDWNNYKTEKKNYMKTVESTLDKSVYGHNETKQQIKRIVGQWINGEMEGQIFGLVGPPGVGKTTICKNGLSKCLVDKNGVSRPFAFLALGGATNGSYLVGHNYTYLGSRWGKIVEILMETKCMNPIIYIDELDKVSRTEHGKEIIGILTHMTDPIQNKEFNDKYFQGVNIDLSKVLFVFSYNDRSLIDRILRDRIQEIRVDSLSKREKLVIANRYLLPGVYKSVGFSQSDIIFSNELISDLIDDYTYEAGVRKLKDILYDIVRELNLKKIVEDDVEIPMVITREFVDDVMSNKPRVQRKKIAKKPMIGMVNGLYADDSGVGGITLIEVTNTPTDKKKLCIEELTGSQGDVMKESMRCALTLTANLLPQEVKENLEDNGLHVHCPEAATPKDGPSAGISITTAMISRICGISVRNTIAMTGEIDIHGNVHKIGGLDAKLNGALMAGVKRVLIPIDNKKDYDKILEKEAEFELSKTFEEDKTLSVKKKCVSKDLDVKLVKNIHEVLKFALVKHDIKFNKVV